MVKLYGVKWHYLDLCVCYVETALVCALAPFAPTLFFVTLVQGEIFFFFLPGNRKHFPYTVLLPYPPDTARGSELLPVSVFNPR